jgi:hypothetical protein
MEHQRWGPKNYGSNRQRLELSYRGREGRTARKGCGGYMSTKANEAVKEMARDLGKRVAENLKRIGDLQPSGSISLSRPLA